MKTFETLNKQYKIVGSTYAIFDNEKVLVSSSYGYADKATKRPVNQTTRFKIASNTKILTALSIFKLYEQGRLSLDDDISKHIPDFSIKSHFPYEKITISDLLSHRSGIPADFMELSMNKEADFHEVLDILKDSYLTSKPGYMCAYSNIGYTLLGIIIENVSGLSFKEYLKVNFLEPMDLSFDFLETAEQLQAEDLTIARSYDEKGEEKTDDLACTLPAGSTAFASLADLVKLGQLFLNKGKYQGKELLKAETIEKMFERPDYPLADPEQEDVGYNLFINSFNFKGISCVRGHGGASLYHHTQSQYLPDVNLGFVIIANSEKGYQFNKDVFVNIMTDYLKNNGQEVKEKESVDYPISLNNGNEIVGDYIANDALISITQDKEGRLVTTIDNKKVYLLRNEDGYYQCFPLELFDKLQAESLKSIRFKKVNYLNEELLIKEVVSLNQRKTIAYASKLKTGENIESWQKALGHYQVISDAATMLYTDIDLYQDNYGLKIDICGPIANEELKMRLLPIGESRALTQGYGRYTRETIELVVNDDGEMSLVLYGMEAMKIS